MLKIVMEIAKGLYYINDSNLKDEAYIYNQQTDIVYKVKKTKIAKYEVHSIEELDYLKKGGERKKAYIKKIKCDTCGKEIDIDSNFCPYCGIPINVDGKNKELQKDLRGENKGKRN